MRLPVHGIATTKDGVHHDDAASGLVCNVSARKRRGCASEEGSVLPLVIGYAGLGLVVILMVVAATSLYIERKRLFTLADGAALAAAESFDLDDVVVSQDTVLPILRKEKIQKRVEEFVAGSDTLLNGLRIVNATTLDTVNAVVTLSAVWRNPVLEFLFPQEVRLEVTSISRSVFSTVRQ